jgi:hypothetical protein
MLGSGLSTRAKQREGTKRNPGIVDCKIKKITWLDPAEMSNVTGDRLRSVIPNLQLKESLLWR